MCIRIVPYQKKYLDDCAAIVRSTWPFEKHLVRPRRPERLYRYYVRDCVNYSEHLEVLVDEEGRAKGVLFGSIERAGAPRRLWYALRQFGLRAGIFADVLCGRLGERRAASAVVRALQEQNRLGETTEDPFDSEVNLFILSPEMRGKGYGRRLMDRYVAFCRRNRLRSAFLWTTLDCTYSFYERYGFLLYRRFYFGGLSPEAAGRPNTMIYYLPIA